MRVEPSTSGEHATPLHAHTGCHAADTLLHSHWTRTTTPLQDHRVSLSTLDDGWLCVVYSCVWAFRLPNHKTLGMRLASCWPAPYTSVPAGGTTVRNLSCQLLPPHTPAVTRQAVVSFAAHTKSHLPTHSSVFRPLNHDTNVAQTRADTTPPRTHLASLQTWFQRLHQSKPNARSPRQPPLNLPSATAANLTWKSPGKWVRRFGKVVCGRVSATAHAAVMNPTQHSHCCKPHA